MTAADGPLEGRRIHITGIVQGVGFRPFVYGLAHRYALHGWVRNTSAGVDIEVDGSPQALDAFAAALRDELPPLARIDRLDITARSPNGFTGFEIHASQAQEGAFQPISPDMTVCADCLRELATPTDRRYRYPFINCTNCGPRFTIIRDIPYDRPLTTMADFPLCADCAAEYHDPLDRRFHAQPVACPVCGPQVWLEPAEGGRIEGEAALQATREHLRNGRIVAIKGLGGFHLACDAADRASVDRLRQRKLRVDKPFAVMMPDLATVLRHCEVTDDEAALLTSGARPIVLLSRRPDSPLPAGLAPGQNQLGVMLPYTPLHALLLEPEPGFPEALVMTSGNLSEEPIAYTNEQAHERLAGLADALLLHDRPIHTRCDDSVMRVVATPGGPQLMPIRRSRGYAPFPVRLPESAPPLLATGAELKNTFCVTRDDYAFLSHHIGDLENYETLVAFESGVAHLERLFRIQPQAIACDLHPDYMATRYALGRAGRENLTAIGVQHHHAHIAACLAERGWNGDRPVIGVSFDGTGYGTDGAIWGGEFLIADYTTAERAAHLRYTPLPGGDRAVREPWRMALAALATAGLPWDDDLPPVRHAHSLGADRLPALAHQLETGLNAPPTSSMGRLFDAVAVLLGVRQTVNYEAQAAVELEALIDPGETAEYPLPLNDGRIDPGPLLAALLSDRRAGVSVPQLAARFHNSLARMVIDVCLHLRHETGLTEVALSGGVWQNKSLLQRVLALAAPSDLTVYTHTVVPANDGGLALGQAAIAAHRLRSSTG